MSSLECVAGQILDKVVDLSLGPVQGTLETVASAPTQVLQGQRATLSDGRLVRVMKSTRVGTSPTLVQARLEFPSPSYPRANNFAIIPAGTVATWIDPPAGVAPTSTTNAFAPGIRSDGLFIAGIAEHDDVDNPAELFAAGVQGSARLILLTPNVRRVGADTFVTRMLAEATWRLRLVLGKLSAQAEPRALARKTFDALVKSLHGATAGNDEIRLTAWTRIRDPKWPNTWEATLLTRVVIPGRTLQAQDAPFLTAGADVRLPGDGAQPGPFRVLDDVDTSS